MINPVSYGVDSLTLVSGVTLGFGPGMTAPPRLLVIVPTAATAITLPTIGPTPPTPPGTPGTSPGVGDGYQITIRNGAAYAVTVSAASGNTLADSLVMNYTGCQETLQACEANSKWYRIVPVLGAAMYRKAGAPLTIATSDRYVNIATAGTITLLAPSSYPPGVEFVTLLDGAGVTYTVAPTSGNINGTAALTVASAIAVGVLTDGSNFFLTHSA